MVVFKVFFGAHLAALKQQGDCLKWGGSDESEGLKLQWPALKEMDGGVVHECSAGRGVSAAENVCAEFYNAGGHDNLKRS